jgi:four helix bundle protein
MKPMNKIRNFKDLIIWQEGISLVKQVYLATRGFPKEEAFGLVQQMRRAAISVPSNIAEGFNRYHVGEKKQSLHISSGSAAELETQSIIAHELGYLDEATLSDLTIRIERLCKMINSPLTKLRGSDLFLAEASPATSYQLPATEAYE